MASSRGYESRVLKEIRDMDEECCEAPTMDPMDDSLLRTAARVHELSCDIAILIYNVEDLLFEPRKDASDPEAKKVTESPRTTIETFLNQTGSSLYFTKKRLEVLLVRLGNKG
jgi:hypothetical protein